MPVLLARLLNIASRQRLRQLDVDVGIHHLLATSDNEVVENPQWYRAEQQKLRVIQRELLGGKKAGVIAVKRCWTCSGSSFTSLTAAKISSKNWYIISSLTTMGLPWKICISTGWFAITTSRKAFWMQAGATLKTHLVSKAVEAGREVIFGEPCLYLQNLLFLRVAIS